MKNIESLRRRRDQLVARIKDAETKVKTKERKELTRKKIVLGAALLSLVKNKEDVLIQRAYNACINSMVERDQALLKNNTDL